MVDSFCTTEYECLFLFSSCTCVRLIISLISSDGTVIYFIEQTGVNSMS